MVKEKKDINKSKKEYNYQVANTKNEENDISDESLDKFENESDGKSSILLLLKFLRTFKLKVGSNIGNISIPVVFIPPKSSLSYFSDGLLLNFDLLLNSNNIDNSLERQFQVYRYLLSTLYHVSILMKPLNSVLGETQMINFHVDTGNGNIETDNYCCCEQISHHPPAFVAIAYNKKYGVKVIFNYTLNMLFMGSYVKVDLLGKSTVILEKYNEIYECTSPSLCGRFLRGFSEYCGESIFTSKTSKYKMVIDCVAKPLVGGEYDRLEIDVLDTESNQCIYNITGSWSGELKIKDPKTKDSKLFYKRPSVSSLVKRIDDTSLETDANNIWKGVFDAHNQGNNKLKSLEKRKVEKQQRQLARDRLINNIQWIPKHFIKNDSINTWDLINK